MSSSAARSGFTLIESVFAIFVFATGALAFAATSAIIVRSLAASSARERSARIASARLEIAKSVTCAQERSGSENLGGFQSQWTVLPSTTGVYVSERVSYVAAGVASSDTYSAMIACAH